MPRKKFPKRPEGVALDFDELCKHDDVCTDVLIDKTSYKSGVQKCKPKYTPIRSIDESHILRIIHDYIVKDNDADKALLEFMRLPGITRYCIGLDTDIERERFQSHAHLYLKSYKKECPWEVTSTNRYAVHTYEAAVTARDTIKPGPVPYLIGSTVKIPVEDTEKLGNVQVMSFMESAKNGHMVMMLGPARLVNHDCNPNAMLRPVDGGVEVVAVRTIQVDEEITVSYGGSFFGPDNQQCLCGSCETLVCGGWKRGRTANNRDLVYRDQTRIPSEYLIVRKLLAASHTARSEGREPGDYVLTRQILVNQYDRWTRCSNERCGSNFLQSEGFQMRQQCPRCERHLLLYNSYWPMRRDVTTISTENVTGDGCGGKCGKGRWVSESVDCQTWRPQLRASQVYVGAADAKAVTRQGQQMEADTARIRGEDISSKFCGESLTLRRSRRFR